MSIAPSLKNAPIRSAAASIGYCAGEGLVRRGAVLLLVRMSKAFDMLAEDGFLNVALAHHLKKPSVSAAL